MDETNSNIWKDDHGVAQGGWSSSEESSNNEVDPQRAIEAAVSEPDRKNSSTTQSASVDQERSKSKKKTKTDNNNDVETLASSIEDCSISSGASKSDNSNSANRHGQSNSAGKQKSILKDATADTSKMKSIPEKCNDFSKDPRSMSHLFPMENLLRGDPNQSGGTVLKTGNGSYVSDVGKAAETRRSKNSGEAQRGMSLTSGGEKQGGKPRSQLNGGGKPGGRQGEIGGATAWH